MPTRRSQRPGYILLVTILVAGAVAIAIATSLLFLATNAGRMGLTIEQSSRALAYANTCMENALAALTADGTYAGDTSMLFSQGSCTIHAVGGSGNADRTICVDGASGAATRHLEATLSRVLPTAQFSIFRETPAITLCT
jgi:hypothetical protein